VQYVQFGKGVSLMAYPTPKFTMIFAAHDNAAAMAEFAHVVWMETLAELEAAGALVPSQKTRFATVARYCRYRAEFEFLYPVYASQGAVKRGPNGEYANMGFAMLNKLEDKLARFDDQFWRWSGGKASATPARPKTPTKADKYLERAMRA